MNQPEELIHVHTGAGELEHLLDGARLNLYGQSGEWSAVVWLDDRTYGVGKGDTWYRAADRALRNAKGKVEK